jgi:hypothetical protein
MGSEPVEIIKSEDVKLKKYYSGNKTACIFKSEIPDKIFRE